MVAGNTLCYNTEREIYVKFHVKMYEALHRSYEETAILLNKHLSYFDKPSSFPPSPMVKYTGALKFLIGVQRPFVMLYRMLDTRICHINNKEKRYFSNLK